ncbi:MAG: radical SAM protein [Flavobacteriales bacterium]|nr:radical SAM protein [Flavobacteriales bacterium]
MSENQMEEAAELILKESIQPIAIDYSKIRSSKKQEIVSGSRKRRLHRTRLFKNARMIFRLYQTPRKVLKVLNMIRLRRNALAEEKNVFKLVSISNRHFRRINFPAWESPLFELFLQSELNRLEPHGSPTHRLTLAYLAITKKCPLKCEHCFEWDNLNQKEKISSSDIDTMIENLQSIGTTNIAFTGGEPMLRVQELINAIRKYKSKSAFWILTSGFNFTAQNATELKAAGLSGLVVSLDHCDPYQHDLFRRTEGSFRDALYAIKYGIENDFVTVISTCITRSTATREHLDQFMSFAKDLGVGFVQFLEPKAVGHYANKDVLLKPEQLELLEEVYLSYNQDPAFKEFPIIVYHGYYNRRVGCFASGNRMVYVDTNGDFLSCPFCHKKTGSILHENFEASLDEMNMASCAAFGSFD